ncbi:hypothetical protein LTR56_006233 [Elasticomyces elasticus]|nr:hypothetical protein LTR56_006233 [Elasticomyces elasticus]KAK3666558.1 hypothetical protein LTR22_002502 [Elasticomyces elasticus]KAK4928309.1 hypothetical protein LTR49_004986 [Elasticomyces elasticus]KAK5763872.1 hypothetical protein LTS12_005990 [Elasticomyces elasticus]
MSVDSSVRSAPRTYEAHGTTERPPLKKRRTSPSLEAVILKDQRCAAPLTAARGAFDARPAELVDTMGATHDKQLQKLQQPHLLIEEAWLLPLNSYQRLDETVRQLETCTTFEELTGPEDDDDLLIRYVAYGRDAATAYYRLDTVWSFLLMFDQYVYAPMDKMSRLVALRATRAMLLHKIRPFNQALRAVPTFFAPTPLQKTRVHACLIDYFVWPKVRDHHISNGRDIREVPQSALSEFARNLKFDWPYEFRDAYMTTKTSGRLVLNPDVLTRFNDLASWKIKVHHETSIIPAYLQQDYTLLTQSRYNIAPRQTVSCGRSQPLTTNSPRKTSTQRGVHKQFVALDEVSLRPDAVAEPLAWEDVAVQQPTKPWTAPDTQLGDLDALMLFGLSDDTSEAPSQVASSEDHWAWALDPTLPGRHGVCDEEVVTEPKQRVIEKDDDGSDEDILNQLLAKSTQHVDQEIDDGRDEEDEEGVIAVSKTHIHKDDPGSSVLRAATRDPLRITKISGACTTTKERLNDRHGFYVCDYMEKLHQEAA